LRSVVLNVPTVKVEEKGKAVKFVLVRRRKGRITCLTVKERNKDNNDEVMGWMMRIMMMMRKKKELVFPGWRK